MRCVGTDFQPECWKESCGWTALLEPWGLTRPWNANGIYHTKLLMWPTHTSVVLAVQRASTNLTKANPREVPSGSLLMSTSRFAPKSSAAGYMRECSAKPVDFFPLESVLRPSRYPLAQIWRSDRQLYPETVNCPAQQVPRFLLRRSCCLRCALSQSTHKNDVALVILFLFLHSLITTNKVFNTNRERIHQT